MKRTRLKRKSKTPEAKLKERLWELCKLIIRAKYPNTCYTCGQTGLVGPNWQTGHLWPKATLGAHLKHDIRVLRPQCWRCNINLGGNGAIFYANMVKELGQEEMNRLVDEKKILIKADKLFYENQIKEYEDYLKRLVS